MESGPSDWLDRINPQVHIAWQGRWRPNHIEPARYLPDHELVVFSAGRCRVEIEGDRFDCEPGTFMIVPPGRRHMTLAGSRPVDRYCVHFDWTYSGDEPPVPTMVWNDHPLPESLVRRVPDWVPPMPVQGAIPPDQEVLGLLETFMARWSAKDPYNHGTCRAVFLEILVRLLMSGSQAARKASDRRVDLALKVKRILDDEMFNDRMDGKFNLPEVLEPLGYSYEHLSRLFHEISGVSPMRYLNARRIEKAKFLLRDPSLSVAEVAREVGFEDPNYFSRSFRRYAGVPPRRYSQLAADPQSARVRKRE